jgi:hypothetical protein
MVLVACGMGPDWKPKPQPAPPTERMFRQSIALVPIIGAGAAVGWMAGRAPWTATLGGWIGLYAGVLALWLVNRRVKGQPKAAPGAAPNPAGK